MFKLLSDTRDKIVDKLGDGTCLVPYFVLFFILALVSMMVVNAK